MASILAFSFSRTHHVSSCLDTLLICYSKVHLSKFVILGSGLNGFYARHALSNLMGNAFVLGNLMGNAPIYENNDK